MTASRITGEQEAQTPNIGEGPRRAARWWADRMREGFDLNNGSVVEEGTIANMRESNPVAGVLMDAARDMAKKGATPERIDVFERELAVLAARELEHLKEHGIWMLMLRCDYDPSTTLAEALTKAGIPVMVGVLPLKTTMHVRHESASVSAGYGADWQSI